MLVLSRKINEDILIGDDIVIKLINIHGGRASIGVTAPKDKAILRGEIKGQVDKKKKNENRNNNKL